MRGDLVASMRKKKKKQKKKNWLFEWLLQIFIEYLDWSVSAEARSKGPGRVLVEQA